MKHIHHMMKSKAVGFNFNDKTADWIVSPFYNDHTAYGAALTMFLPITLSLVFIKSVKHRKN